MPRPLVLVIAALVFAASTVACGDTDPATLVDAGILPDSDGLDDAETDASADEDATAPDAEGEDAGATDAASSPRSNCVVERAHVACPHSTVALDLETIGARQVHFALPVGSPPAAGWPIVLFFQGSFFSSERTWEADLDATFGAYHLVSTFDDLLRRGYAIIAPEAHLDGSTFWDTNVVPWDFAWETSPDHRFMLAVFEAIESGTFGNVDATRMYATGISSGGYMTSRMAVAYPGRFRALAVHSASYATCSGAACRVPDLPADHPPTLFLHGERDRIAPLSAMELYADALDAQGTEVRRVVDPNARHEWIPEAVRELGGWFDAHP